MQADFIIVGQGLAGTLLSYALRNQGKKVLIIDKLTGNASVVAPGMFNPVTGRRLSLSWKADEFLQAAQSIYTKLEKCLGAKFYHPKPIIKIFSSEDDFRINAEKYKTGESEKYIKHFSADAYMAGIKDVGAGICEINYGGFVDTETFLLAWRKKLLAENALLEEDFDYSQLQLSENGVNYKDIVAEKVIFCEGHQAIYNPYFNWLPFNLAKGDVLTISAPGLQQEAIINKSIYIVPLENALFRVGATYKWDVSDISPSAEARAGLEKELQELINVPYTVIDHKAGIRPTVKQRRPFLGLHPEYKSLAIFNGLGTKGVILAPLLAQQMADHILLGKPLFKEVDIAFYDYEKLRKTN